MKPLAALVVAVIAFPPAARAGETPGARAVIAGARLKIQRMAGQRWVTPAMKRLVATTMSAIDGYERFGGGEARAGAGTVDTSLGAPYATIPVGDRVHLTGSSRFDARRGILESHHVGASIDVTALEVQAHAHEADTTFGRTRIVRANATLVPRAPANARERRLADANGLYWPGKVSLSQRVHEPAPERRAAAVRERTRVLTRAERTTDRGGGTPAVTIAMLPKDDVEKALAGHLALARAAQRGRLAPTQRAAVTRAMRQIDALLARDTYDLELRAEDDLNQVVATFPTGERLTFTVMDLAGTHATIELTHGAHRLELRHGDDGIVSVERRRPKTFASGEGSETRTLASTGGIFKVQVERTHSVVRPLGAAEAARIAGD